MPPPQDHDGQPWTVVKPRARLGAPRRPLGGEKEAAEGESAPRSGLPARPRTGGLRPVDEIEAEYRSVRAQWERSACCARLGELVASHAASVAPPPLSGAVCLGIGTFDPPDGAWEAKRKAFVQLIACLFMVRELERHLEIKVPCYFQEPLFTKSDKALISRLGHTVVDSPRGCDLVDGNSLVFAVHLYRPVYAMALRRHVPAIFVGTGWDVFDLVSMEPSSDLDRLAVMERAYAKSPFPQDDSSTAFTSTSIYWRRVSAGRTRLSCQAVGRPSSP